MEKLTPAGSQYEDYTRDEVEREIMSKVFDSNVQTLASANQDDLIIIEPKSDNRLVPSLNTDFGARKRPSPPEPISRRSKRSVPATKSITEEQREQTLVAFLTALHPLSEQEGVANLLERTAKRLEHDLFDKVSNNRPVNALGRSSTLVTTSRKAIPPDKYNIEKDKLLQKIEAYVLLASRDNVELGQVQQGEIWQVIKTILDEDS